MAIVHGCLASDAEADEMLVNVLADFVGPIDHVVAGANSKRVLILHRVDC